MKENIRLVFLITIMLVLFGVLFVMVNPDIGFLLSASLSGVVQDCSDHIDNDGNGYCDFATKNGYCQDGSILGDPNCSVGGSEMAPCVPSPEVCDGIDNNCNGKIDENIAEGRNCGLNVGECKYGKQTRGCYDGQWGEWSACFGGINPKKEKCNKKDDNCNGVIDENCQ